VFIDQRLTVYPAMENRNKPCFYLQSLRFSILKVILYLLAERRVLMFLFDQLTVITSLTLIAGNSGLLETMVSIP